MHNPQHPHDDRFIYSDENIRLQLATAEDKLGYKVLRFYVDDNGIIAKENTGQTDVFYLLPSGGTLRDKDLNLVGYKAKFDIHKGLGRVKK